MPTVEAKTPRAQTPPPSQYTLRNPCGNFSFTRRPNKANLRVKHEQLGRLRDRPRIFFEKLRHMCSAILLIPLVVIIPFLNYSSPAQSNTEDKSHSVVRLTVLDRIP